MQLIDTARYPVDRLGSAEGRCFVEECAQAFAATGVLVLPGFLTGDAVAAIRAEASEKLDQAFFCRNLHTVLLDKVSEDAESVPDQPGDVMTRPLRTSVGSIANDLLDTHGVLQQLYDQPELTAFIGAVLSYDEFHRSADPLGAVSINVYGPGDGHQWHFDEAPFSVTLMIQESDEGGHFEYVTGVRSERALDLDRIGRVLDGDESFIERLAFAAGSLSIFAGRNTMHRVTPVSGERPRFVPVLTYSATPGSMNSPEVRELFWGRIS